MTLAWSRFEAEPFGRGVVVCEGRVVVRVFLPTDSRTLERQLRDEGLTPGMEDRPGGAAREAAKVLTRAFFGEDLDTGSLAVQLPSRGPFLTRVLEACRRIPAGSVRSYKDLAGEAGSPLATRAVGNAMATNPVPLLIPCHRVVLTGGAIGNYGGGVPMKRWLLDREKRLANAKG
jgi:O-6-methylguanine DNA methyltransferase